MTRALSRATGFLLVTVLGVGLSGSRGATSEVVSSDLTIAGQVAVPSTSMSSWPQFAWTSSSLDGTTRSLMTGRSWRHGCPVGLGALRVVSLSYWGFDHKPHRGQLVVNADSVNAVVKALRSIYLARFPIRQMRLVDYYAGDDERSMANDNTSAFNCRIVPGTTVWSQHAYGRAVDINPLENPEVLGSKVDPPSARRWADRRLHDVGLIHHGDVVWRAFTSVGWKWGGDWTSLKDYQHFSANGY